jgi:hypothetical protein
MFPLKALEPGVARCEPRILFHELLGLALDLLDRFPLLQNPLLERVLPHSFVDQLDDNLLLYDRRHSGSYARNSCLLRYVDGSGSQEVDIVISSKEGDQRKEQSSEKRDPALTVKSQHQCSQPKP